MGDRPGRERADHGRVGTAIGTSTFGNATAFGFSITITATFGVLQTVVGSPTVIQILMFGVAAALTIGLIEGLVTRGFRARVGTAPSEVAMLGTAQNFISVGLGIGAAAGVAEAIHSGAAWPAAAAAATLVFLAAESAETLLAELIEERRGDPDAGKAKSGG